MTYVIAANRVWCKDLPGKLAKLTIEALEHLVRWRGASVGVEAAEAFVLGRNLVV